MVEISDAVVRVGVIGGGLIAQLAHLPALRELDGLFALRALADPSPRTRERLARRHGIAIACAGHEELLERAEVDAVLVCSPNGTHARVVAEALDAGLHVLVEKPLCLSPADATAIVDRARDARRVVQVGYMKRFDPGYERLAELAGTLGAARVLSTLTVDPGIGEQLRPPGHIAATDVPGTVSAALQGETAAQVAAATGSEDPRHVVPYSDAFAGALVHDVNLALGLLPGPWRIADAASDGDGALAYGALAHPDGARWSATWARVPAAGEFRQELVLCAAAGLARLRFPAPYLGAAPAELTLHGAEERRRRAPANAYVRQLEHFHACITQGVACRTPAGQAARDVALLAELYRAVVAMSEPGRDPMRCTEVVA